MKFRKRKWFSKLSIAVLIITLFIFFILRGWRWEKELENIPLPKESNMIDSTFQKRHGTPYEGSNDTKTYLYYLVIQSALEKNELENFYTSFIVEINNKFTGYETSIYIIPIEESIFTEKYDYLGIRNVDLLEKLRENATEYGTNDLYLVLMLKPGRSFFFN